MTKIENITAEVKRRMELSNGNPSREDLAEIITFLTEALIERDALLCKLGVDTDEIQSTITY